jgi:hypothetical protein
MNDYTSIADQDGYGDYDESPPLNPAAGEDT